MVILVNKTGNILIAANDYEEKFGTLFDPANTVALMLASGNQYYRR